MAQKLSGKSTGPPPQSTRLKIKVSPGSAEDKILGYLGEELKINLKAPPVDGKANRALLQFLARALALKPRDLVLLAGGTGRSKIVQITGLEASEIDSRLNLNQTKQILPKP